MLYIQDRSLTVLTTKRYKNLFDLDKGTKEARNSARRTTVKAIKWSMEIK